MSRILSGIRPSGQLHLGNYLGAIKQWIALQDQHQAFFMVADLHAITTPYEVESLQPQIRETILDYLAAGLDPAKTTLFIQSQVPAHAELMWLLSTITPIGELQRMVQYKEKSAANPDFQNAGILNYPILMAADILAYKADRVPVGDDQGQHVELARDVAKKFNRLFGQTFPEPLAVFGGGKRIMSLANPMEKMSKTGGEGIALTDEESTIKKKIQKAVSTSEPRVIREAFRAAEQGERGPEIQWQGDPTLLKQFHGVRNLFTILLVLGLPKDTAQWKAAAEAGKIQFSQFKPTLATIIAEHFAPFRARREQLAKDETFVRGVIDEGGLKANQVAEQTLAEVQAKMGLR
ncbi:MAG: tryptophan--tRNA ligase [Candidatus Kerfeldbacteria bacterium]|nr:tryptophan--tRNA ligase [Candidatus Kerfeldbacteria bacterium]